MRSQPRGSVLLADDEEGILKTLGRALREEGHDVTATASAAEAQRLLAERSFDVLVVDHRMPGRTGLEIIRDLAAAVPEGERPQVLMMTAHATVENAIEAMKLGAYDYLQKPFEVDELLVAVRRALEHQSLSRQHRYLLSEREEDFDHYGIVGRSRAVEELLRKIELVARSKSTVLVTGETGTGKELVARAIHARSAQHDMPLIKVNCAAIPETLLESELFGHVKGRVHRRQREPPGPLRPRRRRDDLPRRDRHSRLPVQAKLLRVLQEREFEPVGAERTLSVDVRVIAATNRDLRAMVADGRFQEDLFYRLSVIPVELPPLRERPRGRPAPRRALRPQARRSGWGGSSTASTPEALARLGAYRWPGNVRELENAIERAVVLATGTVIDAAAISMVEPLAPVAPGGLPSVRLHENVEWAEQESVRRALRQANGVKKDAAEVLGISQRALSYYLGKYKVE